MAALLEVDGLTKAFGGLVAVSNMSLAVSPGEVLVYEPPSRLAERAGELSGDKPIVAVCRAGGRSAQATNILREAGFERVANLPGGMLRWRAEGRAM